MKKSIFAIFAALIFMSTTNISAEEAKFIRNYDYGARFYENAEYLNGNYRSNFISIPQNRMLNYKDGFERKIGVFELEGNTLFVGYSEDGSGALQLCDENGKMWISKDSYKEREESYFKYQGGGSGGVITQIELKGKKYTLVIAGISSNKAGIYSDYDGFRMWVENEAPNDTAASKTIDKVISYDDVDIREGVFKPGYTRLWGEVIERPENAGFIYKYSYKGSDFIFNNSDNSDDFNTCLQNTDGSLIPLNRVSVFYIYQSYPNGKNRGGFGLGIEADVQLGNNKVRIVYSQCDGNKRVWVKDTSGYPVIQQKNTNHANSKTKKTEKTKKSGKSAAFTRDYEKYRRIYSIADISKGIYKSNYKNIEQTGSEELTFTVTETGEKTDIKTGVFELNKRQISVLYEPNFLGWQPRPVTPIEGQESWRFTNKKYFTVEGSDITGLEADVSVNNEIINTIAVVCLDNEKGDYRLFVKTGPDAEPALNDKDNFGIEYFDIVDILAGVYKPNFEFIERSVDKDESHKALFKDATDNDPVFIFDYKGYKFLIGSTQDPANYVKNLDGSVIYNPETQLRFIIRDKNGNTFCHQGISYGWEGNVKLGDKDVTLAYFKWGAAVCAFVKE